MAIVHMRSVKFSSYFAKYALALHLYWLSVGGYTPIYQFVVPFCTLWSLLSVIRSRLKKSQFTFVPTLCKKKHRKLRAEQRDAPAHIRLNLSRMKGFMYLP